MTLFLASLRPFTSTVEILYIQVGIMDGISTCVLECQQWLAKLQLHGRIATQEVGKHVCLAGEQAVGPCQYFQRFGVFDDTLERLWTHVNQRPVKTIRPNWTYQRFSGRREFFSFGESKHCTQASQFRESKNG